MFDEATLKLNVDPLILSALKEDITYEDVSTNAVMPGSKMGEVDLIAKQDGILCGIQVFERVFSLWIIRQNLMSFLRMETQLRRAKNLPRLPETSVYYFQASAQL